MQALPIVMLVLLLSGLCIGMYALNKYRNRTATTDQSWWDRQFTPIWKQKSHFTNEKGFTIYIIGTLLVILGAFVGVLYFLLLR